MQSIDNFVSSEVEVGRGTVRTEVAVVSGDDATYCSMATSMWSWAIGIGVFACLAVNATSEGGAKDVAASVTVVIPRSIRLFGS